jgi:hypothetical protein
MSAWNYSLVFIFADADKPDANKLAAAMGHCPPDADEYTVPLSATGENPPTHWLCHSFCVPEFAAMLAGIEQGALPTPEAGGAWEDYKLDEARVWELMKGAVVSCVEGADPVTHVAEVLEANGLQKCSLSTH